MALWILGICLLGMSINWPVADSAGCNYIHHDDSLNDLFHKADF